MSKNLKACCTYANELRHNKLYLHLNKLKFSVFKLKAKSWPPTALDENFAKSNENFFIILNIIMDNT